MLRWRALWRQQADRVTADAFRVLREAPSA
jgi:hypothetical protein